MAGAKQQCNGSHRSPQCGRRLCQSRLAVAEGAAAAAAGAAVVAVRTRLQGAGKHTSHVDCAPTTHSSGLAGGGLNGDSPTTHGARIGQESICSTSCNIAVMCKLSTHQHPRRIHPDARQSMLAAVAVEGGAAVEGAAAGVRRRCSLS